MLICALLSGVTFNVGADALEIGAAIGLATGHDAESLLVAADRAMYADKFS